MGHRAGRIQEGLSGAALAPESFRPHSCHMPHRWQNTVEGTARGYTGKGNSTKRQGLLGAKECELLAGESAPECAMSPPSSALRSSPGHRPWGCSGSSLALSLEMGKH